MSARHNTFPQLLTFLLGWPCSVSSSSHPPPLQPTLLQLTHLHPTTPLFLDTGNLAVLTSHHTVTILPQAIWQSFTSHHTVAILPKIGKENFDMESIGNK